MTWFLFFLGAPIALIAALSFFTRGTYGGVEWIFTLENYSRVVSPVYLVIFLKTLKLATVTAVSCLLIAYPIAWAIATSPPRWRKAILIGLAIPFFTNLIIRVYAIKLFIGQDGPLQAFLTALSIPFDPYGISANQTMVFYGMITSYLPFMIFPLYAALEKFDFALVEAAQDLGLSNEKILFKILLPNTKQAALNGFTLVFVPCLGEFVIPDLLGGAKTMLMGNLITEQFLKSRHWPLGAALSVTLMIILLLIPPILKKVTLRKRTT